MTRGVRDAISDERLFIFTARDNPPAILRTHGLWEWPGRKRRQKGRTIAPRWFYYVALAERMPEETHADVSGADLSI